MDNGNNGHSPEAIGELSAQLSPREEETITPLVRRMVIQCGSLLRQQLERKARQEPMLYDASRIDRVMQEFLAASLDVEATIADRVRSRLIAHIQQEVRWVLEDALSDGIDSVENVIVSPNAGRVFPHIEAEPPQAFGEERRYSGKT